MEEVQGVVKKVVEEVQGEKKLIEKVVVEVEKVKEVL